jgi:hypothetical protein
MINIKTLWAPILTHATYNALTILDWDCLQGKWNPIEATPAMIGTGLVAVTAAIVGFSFCVFLVMQKGIEVREHPDSRST